MLTRHQVEIYARFDGDSDGYSRSTRHNEQPVVDHATWRLLDELTAAAALVKRGLASPEFEAKTRSRIANATESASVADLVFEIA